MRFPRPLSAIIPHYPHAALISTALLVSSFTKLFPLLLLIWYYDLPSSASAVSWAVIINNVAALEILLDCGYVRAAFLAAIGAVCRAGVGWVSVALLTRILAMVLEADIIYSVHTADSRRWRRCSCCWCCGDGGSDQGLEAVDRTYWGGMIISGHKSPWSRMFSVMLQLPYYTLHACFEEDDLTQL